MQYPGVIDRYSLGSPRPERSWGRHVLDSQSPNRCPAPCRPSLARPGHAGVSMSPSPLFVGIAVAKAHRASAVRPTGECWTVTHDEAGITALVARLQRVAPTLIVLQATGGYQRAVVAALAAAGLPSAVVNPRQVRDFAKATGQLARTDALDARALAHFAEAVRPAPRPLPDAHADELRALLARRRQLIAMRTTEQNRLGNAPPRLQP